MPSMPHPTTAARLPPLLMAFLMFLAVPAAAQAPAAQECGEQACCPPEDSACPPPCGASDPACQEGAPSSGEDPAPEGNATAGEESTGEEGNATHEEAPSGEEEPTPVVSSGDVKSVKDCQPIQWTGGSPRVQWDPILNVVRINDCAYELGSRVMSQDVDGNITLNLSR